MPYRGVVFPMPDVYDITLPLHARMTLYPGDPPFLRELVAEIGARGGGYRLARLALSAHAGTHVDAPAHVLPGGSTLDDLAPDFFCGPARVFVCRGPVLNAAALAALSLRAGEFALFRTHDGRLWQDPRFRRDFTALDVSGAELAVAAGVRGVGVDYLSVGRAGEEESVHRVLLQANLAVIEGLDLARVAPGEYDLLCLPMRIHGGEGAPARALLWPRTTPVPSMRHGQPMP